MLTDSNKTSTLWKSYKGWGSTHSERAVFEELYKSYKDISVNSVLTYGNLLPISKDELFYEDIKNLDTTNDTLYYKESSFKTVPLVKKYTDYKLTKISSNCNHAFVILDSDGNQLRNIIPYDYSDTGLYNYTLKNSNDIEIAWGTCDWILDTNSSILTFNNSVPEGIDAENPPKLTFYQYIGPVGERHYIDASLLSIDNIEFDTGNPVTEFTNQVKERLEDIEVGFFDTYGFNGDDTAQGIGLQYNILDNVKDTETGDPLKGYDDNSNSQVVHLLSHKTGNCNSENIRILFVSEGIDIGEYDIQVTEKGISKIDLDNGFFVIKADEVTNYKIHVVETKNIYGVLLVKNNVTNNFELFFPRNKLSVTLSLPIFVDLIHLPPHLKLTSLSSYSDHITPQYYGPRVIDYVIASDGTSINYRSADFVVYNKENFYLSDAIKNSEGNNILLRNGYYESIELINISEKNISGESENYTRLKNVNIKIKKGILENLILENCNVEAGEEVIIRNCKFINNSKIIINGSATFNKVTLPSIENNSTLIIFDSNIENIINNKDLTFYNSTIYKIENKNNLKIYGSYVEELTQNNEESNLYINGTNICTLDIINTNSEKTIISTSIISYVKNLPFSVKLDTSYVTKFSENIIRQSYPDEKTIPYYKSFKERVYAKLPEPFKYNENKNQIEIKLDTIENTIFLNENGELQVRFFTGNEISLLHPENIATQIEDVYGEHGDTVLNTERPVKVEDAILDLYWAKADLKNGKVPIDQLPDSVAYGGLTLVGMWQFEDHNGEYPTFEDVDTEFSSDDQYSSLQNGWFFIVSASNEEDDPVAPQKSIDGIEWTAGDWIIYTGGGSRRVPDFSKEITFTYKNIESKLFSKDENTFTYQVSYKTSIKEENEENGSNDSKTDDSNDSDSKEIIYTEVGTVTIDKKGIITNVWNLPEDFTIGVSIDSIKHLRITKFDGYVIKNVGGWQKLDRAYQDPVYSRLPELATKAGSTNPQWSILDGGTGLLRLSYKSLAEAIRLLNEQFLKYSPNRPTSIQFIELENDNKSLINSKEYLNISNGLQLNQIIAQNDIKKAYEQKGTLYFNQSKGNTPLENCFYCGDSSTIKIYDNDKDITSDCNIDRFDPYERYRLSFKAPSYLNGALVKGFVEFGKTQNYNFTHNIRIVQTDLIKSSLVEDDINLLEGCSKTFTISEKYFYDFSKAAIQSCKTDTINKQVLNNILQNNRIGGYGYFPNKVDITGTFVIKDFAENNLITPDAFVDFKATYKNEEIDTEITSQTFVLTNKEKGIYDINVSWKATLSSEDYTYGDFIGYGKAGNNNKVIDWTKVIEIKNITVINVNNFINIKESGINLYPSLGTGTMTNTFGDEYQIKVKRNLPQLQELSYENGFCWPTHKYLEEVEIPESLYIDPNKDGYAIINNLYYKFVLYKISLASIKDLNGFMINMDWNIEPQINPLDGSLENILLQVCVSSNEKSNRKLMDANKPADVFYTANFALGEACGFMGLSDINHRRVTFGRNPAPIQDIYIRVGIPSTSKANLKNITISF